MQGKAERSGAVPPEEQKVERIYIIIYKYLKCRSKVSGGRFIMLASNISTRGSR